jgi:hypothetical protein
MSLSVQNITPVIGAERARAFVALCWNLEQVSDARALTQALA